MADMQYRSSHRGGGRPDRRDRPRDDDRSHRRDDDRDNHRRNRSRSPRDRPERPDRRDRKRDYDADRRRRDEPENTHREKDDGRDRARDRGSKRDRDAGRDREGGKPRDREDKKPTKEDDRKPKPAEQPSTRQRTTSPPRRRSASPKSDRQSEDRDLDLPTRSRKDKAGTPSAPVHIKIGSVKHDGDRHDTPDEGRERTKERDEATPMDMDDPDDDIVIADEGLDAMQAMMGFGSFGSTKGKKIPGNNVGAVRKEKKTEYRQYMNRVGGFNRPLSPGR